MYANVLVSTLTRWQHSRLDDAQRLHTPSQRHQAIKCEDDGGRGEVCREYSRLQQAAVSVNEDEDEDGVEEAMTDPEGGEEAHANARLREDEDDADDEDEKETGHPWQRRDSIRERRRRGGITSGRFVLFYIIFTNTCQHKSHIRYMLHCTRTRACY